MRLAAASLIRRVGRMARYLLGVAELALFQRPPPNPADPFPITGLSSDYCVSDFTQDTQYRFGSTGR